MPKFSNIWSKAFSTSSFEKEEWLEPSPEVFERVKAEIYGKRKKRGFVWLLPLLLGLSGIAVLAFIYNGKSGSVTEQVSIEITEDPTLPLISSSLTDNEKVAEELPSEEISTADVMDQKAESLSQITNPQPASESKALPRNNLSDALPLEKVPAALAATNNEASSLANGEKRSSIAISPDAINALLTDMDPSTSPGSRLPGEVFVATATAKPISDLAQLDNGSSELNSKISRKGSSDERSLAKGISANSINVELSDQEIISSKHSNIDPSQIDILEKNNQLQEVLLLPIDFTELQFDRNLTLTTELEPIHVDKRVLRNEFRVALGYSNWNFNLNSSYETALDPADFTYESGHGIVGLLSYTRKVNDKLGLGVDFSIERITSRSGHNSSVQYRLENEHDGQVNDLMLTMASPLGFIESEVTVERRAAAGGLNQNMVLDLHNTHRVSNISLVPMLSYEVVGHERLSFIVSAGVGVNYLAGIRNNLDYFGVDNTDFSSVSSKITADQTSFQQITAFSSIGIHAKRRFINNNFIGVSARLNNNLAPIFKLEDFSTSIVRTQFTMFFGKNF